MDKDLKARWVAALRSGDYEQGRGQLRTEDDKFCCLGVLADLIDPNGWACSDGADQLRWRDELATLPSDVCRLQRAMAEDPDGYETQDVLAAMNDGGASFAEIADYIEANL